jgi:hypothetical protein
MSGQTMQTILVSGLTKEEFYAALREIVSEEVGAALKTSAVDSELLSVKELQLFLKVSRVTIASWVKKGLLTKLGIGGRVFFRKEEVLASLNKIKKYELNILK